jgi:hypothetical protein
MVRKTQKVAFESISADVAASIILATTGTVKDKTVDPRKQIGTIHIKKYLAIERINQEYENWIALLRKSIQAKSEGQSVDFTAEEQTLLDRCKQLTAQYLEEEGSDALKQKVTDQADELEKLKNIASSMKYKFSTYSFEVITHMVNLMVRELLVFTCDSCLAKNGKLTKEAHVPWNELRSKMISGLYMNTPLVYNLIHKTDEETDVVEEAEEETAVDEEASAETESTSEVTETTEDGEVVEDGEDKPKVKKFRPKLTQYITNAFKEITTREPRFHGLLLGKEVTALVNNLIYQVMDRYVNVIKSLLRVGNSKTITDHLAVIATVILLRDDIHTTDEDVQVIVDLLQERVEALKAAKALKSESGETESVQDETVEETVVEEPTPKGKGRVKKSS